METESLAQIALEIGEKPRTADVLRALARAERVGYQRALLEAAAAVKEEVELPSILRKQWA
jgi:hypothetical protein